jgi:hypothetical protein
MAFGFGLALTSYRKAAGGGGGATTDPSFPYVPLLLETGASSSRSTTVVDSSTNNFTVTRTGAPSTGLVSPYQTDGYWSWFFGGTGNYAVTNTAPLAATTSTFTIECWIYPTATPVGTLPVVIGDMQPTGGTNYLSFGILSSRLLQLYWYDGAAKGCTGNTTISLNTWTHIAASVNANAITLYVNGVSQTLSGTTTLTNRNGSIGSFAIGQYNTAIHYYTGYISNLSVLNGTAKYSTGFTPTTSPLSVSTTNQTLLACYSNRFIDSNTATTAKTITTTGTPQVLGYWYPSTFTAPTASPGAGYFSGTTDCLLLPTSPLTLSTTGSFTLEAWVYTTSTSDQTIFYLLGNTTTYAGIRVGLNSSAAYILHSQSGSNWAVQSGNQGSVPVNTWNHIAVTRNVNAGTLWINGVSVYTFTFGTLYSSTVNYIAAMYFNTAPGLLFSGYISNARVVNGTSVYTGAFTPPTLAFLQTSGSASAASYPSTTNVNTSFAAANTSLLVNLADSNYVSATNGVQNNTFIDNSNYAFPITRNGTPTQGSVTPYWPNGQWSNYFNGTTDYLSVASNAAFGFGTGDFTFECWAYFTKTSNDDAILDFRISGGGISQIKPTFIFTPAGNVLAYVVSGTARISSNALNIGQWYHLAVVKSSSVTKLYINGTQQGSSYSDSNNYGTTSSCNIGTVGDSPGFSYLGAYISNLRVVKGTAVYTATFTPPTSPLTAITNTSLLTCQSNRFLDNSANAFAITATGTPTVQAFQPFSPTASYTTAAYGGSGYLNGTADYVSVSAPNGGLLDLAGSTDFTIELWFYATSLPTAGNLYSRGGINGSQNSQYWAILDSSGSLQWGFSAGGTSSRAIQNINGFKTNTWYHFAITCSGNTFIPYVNGVAGTTVTGTGSLPTSVNNPTLWLGALADSATRYFFPGYITGFRIVRGAVVYAGNFTPPTLAPLTAAGSTSAASYPSTANVNTTFASSITSLLTNFSNAGIYDAAVQNNVITVGDAQASTTQYKWSPTSMKFDGTGDWLTAIDNPQLQLGTGNFTIEGWFYLTANGTAYGIVSKGAASTGWSVNVTSGNRIQFSYTASNLTGATTTLAASTWYYFAIVRSGSATGNLKIYINGALEVTSGGAVTDNFNQTSILYVGASRTGTTPLNGYLQDIRITKAARTITASPPAAFPTR